MTDTNTDRTGIDAKADQMSDTLSNWERTEAEREQRRREEWERTIALQERQIAAHERLAEAQHHVVQGDSAVDRMTVFFNLPQEVQDFKLREEAVMAAARIGGDIATVLANADRIVAYIRGA